MEKAAATNILFIVVAVLIIGIILFADKLKSSGTSLSEIIGGIRANIGKEAPEEYVPDEILMKFNPGVGKADEDELLQRYSLNEVEEIPEIKVKVLKVNPKALDAVIEALSHNPNVEFAEKNYIGQVAVVYNPNDPYFTSGYQWGITKVKAPDAWGITKGSSNVKIAILDTGIDKNHPDLAGKIVSSQDFTGSPNSYNDMYGHGTHSAGIAAAATNNGVGVAGLGFNSRLINAKVCDNYGKCTTSSVASGIGWAVNTAGANVISMSLTVSPSTTLQSAINSAWSKGAVLVCAAGNSGSTNPAYPAYYTNCIAVAGTNSADNLALLSNYGTWVDVAAPGYNIYSTLPNSNYGYKTGTSEAAPYVAGLAALLFTTVKDTNGNGKINDEVRSKIESNCDKIPVNIAYGRINAFKAASPSAPSLFLPLNGATGVSKTPALDWSDTIVTGGWYYIYYKKSTDTSWSYANGQLTSSQYTFTSALSSNTKYNWGVWACNLGSSCTNSTTYSFTTRT